MDGRNEPAQHSPQASACQGLTTAPSLSAASKTISLQERRSLVRSKEAHTPLGPTEEARYGFSWHRTQKPTRNYRHYYNSASPSALRLKHDAT